VAHGPNPRAVTQKGAGAGFPAARRALRRIRSENELADRIDAGGSQAAGRYAQAIFELARDGAALEAIEADFARFEAAWRECADLRALARSPLVDPADKARAIVAVAQKLGLSELGANALGVASANRRAGEIPAIFADFRARLAQHRGERRIEIISARPLSKTDQGAIVDVLAKSLGGKIAADARVDESLIGGFVVRVGSRQFDASVKSKLDALALALKSA